MASSSTFIRAQLQFVRILDRFCSNKDVLWNISGSFVRSILTTTNNDYVNLEVHLYSKEPGSANDVLKDLKIVKIIKQMRGKLDLNPRHYTCSIEILEGTTIHTFDVMFHIDVSRTQMSSFDNIVLSPVGLVLNSLDPKHDELNVTTGIALLSRLVDLKMKEIRLSGSYYNVNMNINIRKRNAQLMRAQDSFLNEGFTILGDYVLKISKLEEECPICYEKELNCTKLKCGHTFCVQCLATHMSKIEMHSSTCPLCRGLIVLDF
jgi:hypothetical protein